ncbi:MAG: gamma-glutamyl-gamma-aminobutyrate hydrolase family protein [Bacillota bacterium]
MPIIGLTPSIQSVDRSIRVYAEYLKAVHCAGGIPVVLSPWPPDGLEVLRRIDGLLLTGGHDVDPAVFGEEPEEGLGEITPERDVMEMSLTRAALEMDMPVLAICRGIQVLNVAAGGTLYQDIKSQVRGAKKHRQDAPRWYPTHEVRLRDGTRIASIACASRIRVNSFHHQAVRELGENMLITGEARDGIIEAIESAVHRFVVGVQWHPEMMYETDSVARALFSAFVAAAGAGR